jgi:glucose-6-phosphate isomerase
MPIQFDETNLRAVMVGASSGLTDSEIRRYSPLALNALADFRKACEAGRYGFPYLPFQRESIREIQDYAASVKGSYDTVCIAGIGGSALGAWALDCAIRGPHLVQSRFSTTNPRLTILDNVDPSFVDTALATMNPKRTLVLAIAKSGATAETAATFLILRDWLRRTLGSRAHRRIAAVTSRGRGDLAVLAEREQYRTFFIPDNVGGRFSVLSPVGLLPAALVGLDIQNLARGAARMTQVCWLPDLNKNLALRAALLHYLIWTLKNKTIHVVFPYSNQLWGTAYWFRQLWAESLGKAKNRDGKIINVGQTPVAALGATDQHSQVQLYVEGPRDKVTTFWAVKQYSTPGRIPKQPLKLEAFDYLAGRSLAELIEAERLSTAAALTEHGRPNCTFTLDRINETHLGAFLQLMEFTTAFTGELLNINAFDQEGVELGKKFTYGLLGRKGFEAYRERFQLYQKKRRSAVGKESN